MVKFGGAALFNRRTTQCHPPHFSTAVYTFAPASFPVTMPSAALNVAASNTLDLGGAPSVTLGGLTLDAGSALTLANAPAGVTFSSITANGTSQITAGSPMSLSSGIVSVPAGQTLTVENAIASGSITKQNSGTLLLSGISTYTGATNINTGTLTLAGTGALGNTAVTVAGGAVFSVKPGAVIGTTGAGTSGATLTLSAGSALTMADGVIGTFNIQQNVSFASDGLVASVTSGTAPSLSFDLGNGTIDLINVTKAVTTTNAVRGQVNFTTLPGLTSLTPGNYPFINAGGGLGASAFTLNIPRIVVGTSAYDLSLASSTASQEILSISPYTGPAPIQFFTPIAAGAPINLRPNTGINMSIGTLSNTGVNPLAVNLTSTAALSVTGLSSSGNPVANGSPGNISGTINSGVIAGARSWQVTNTDNTAVNPAVSVGGTVNVYDFANAKYNGGAVAFGNVHKQSIATTSVLFGNQTVTSANFQDLLGVSATTSNPSITATGFSGLAPSTNGSSTGSLIFSANTNAVGSLAGTVTLNLMSLANGVSGLSNGAATVVGAPAPVTITGQVYSGLMIWNGSSGNWNSDANWNDSQSASIHAPPGLDAVFTNVDTATFGNTAGAVTVNMSGAAPSLNAITFNNTGSYTIEGTGAIKLAGTAPTIASSGTHITSTPLTLANNLGVSVNSGTLTISGAIGQTGTAALTKSGAGMLNLGGANTFTGATTITGGVLSINSIQNAGSATPNALGRPTAGANSIIALADTATLRFTGSSSGSSDRVINLSAATGGTFTLDASGTVPFALTSTITTSGTSGISTLTLTGSGNGSEGGVITNGTGTNITAVTKSGPGTWALAAANTYTGTTTVSEGTLYVTGTISGTTIVNSGGTLSGDGGILGDITVNSGGTFSPPGASHASATNPFNTGTLNFGAGSIFQFEIETDTPTIDVVSVTGNLNITSGAIFSAGNLGSAVLPEGFAIPAIIDYSGTWNGGVFKFMEGATLRDLNDDSVFLIGANAYQISYNGFDGASSEVTLTVVPEPGAAVSLLGGLGLLLGVRRRRV